MARVPILLDNDEWLKLQSEGYLEIERNSRMMSVYKGNAVQRAIMNSSTGKIIEAQVSVAESNHKKITFKL